jgi:hypothetical protein
MTMKTQVEGNLNFRLHSDRHFLYCLHDKRHNTKEIKLHAFLPSRVGRGGGGGGG